VKLSIDPDASAPPFEQVRAAIIAAVRSGELAPGAKLPTVRGLAEQLGLAVNTVAKAYRELESEEVIETRGRNGSFVSAHGDPSERMLQHAASDYAAVARRLGVDHDAALAAVESALRAPAE
jgi:DNA-binding transcriptional regulator YhcF (GntR family)